VESLDADEGYHKALIAGAKKFNAAERFALMVEMLMWLDLETETTLPKWAKAFEVNLKPIKKLVEEQIKSEEAETAREKELVPGLEWMSRPPANFEWGEEAEPVCKNPFKLAVKLKVPKNKRYAITICVAQRDSKWHGAYELDLGSGGVAHPVIVGRGHPTMVKAAIDEAYGILGWMRDQKVAAALIEQMSAHIQALLKLDDPDPASPKPAVKASRKGGKKGGK
jgi:hypothetical protein